MIAHAAIGVDALALHQQADVLRGAGGRAEVKHVHQGVPAISCQLQRFRSRLDARHGGDGDTRLELHLAVLEAYTDRGMTPLKRESDGPQRQR